MQYFDRLGDVFRSRDQEDAKGRAKPTLLVILGSVLAILGAVIVYARGLSP